MSAPSRRVLDPVDRLSEVLFGLIMALTFTCSLSAATSGREEVRTMLAAALGCNVAWGIVDAVMFLLATLLERGKGLAILREVRSAADAGHAQAAVRDALPPLVASILRPEDLDPVRRRLVGLPESRQRPWIEARDLRGALGVFLLVSLATVPVALPFLFIQETHDAMRLSNGVALTMLFACGHSLGRYAGLRPWLTGFTMLAGGAVLVMITIALGG